MLKSKLLLISCMMTTLLVGCGSKPKFNAEYCDGLHQPKKSILDSANANDPQAQLDMAEMYFVGYCGDKDIVKAKEWFLKSANQDYTPAQLTFGAAYLNADMDDVDQAIFWLNKVIEKNDKYASGAMYFMADIYYYEVFGRQDKDKAFYWLEKSAQLGHPMAKEKLAEWKN